MHRMFNQEVINKIINEDRFAVSHGAQGDYLGVGVLYYGLTYMLRAQIAVCLGSGSGFVPKLMRQAQRDQDIPGSKTYLIDADISGWGNPDYHGRETKFRQNYPEVILIKEKTIDAVKHFSPLSIDYLHIDADHSYEGVKADHAAYYPLVKSGGIITFHDTVSPDCGVKDFLLTEFIEHLNIKIGNGTAVHIKP